MASASSQKAGCGFPSGRICAYFSLRNGGLLNDPGEYKWSSYGTKALGRKDMIVDFHMSYLALGESDGARQKAYAEYVHGTVPEHEMKLLREALQRSQLMGGDRR